MKWSRLPLIFALCLVFVACDSDENNDEDTGTTDVIATDTEGTDGNADVEPDVPTGPQCDPLEVTDPETATYDVFLDAGNDGFYGTAEVTRTGTDVSVTVDTDTFAGAFQAGANCVPPQEGLLFPLCFLNADGTSAASETLGATLVTGPNGTIGIIGAHRRGADRKCTVAGAYALTLSNIAVTPTDADTTNVDALTEDLGGQFMIFILPESKPIAQTVGVIGTKVPRLINPFALEGESFTEFSRDVISIVEKDAVEFSVKVTGTNGTFDPAAGTVEFTLEIDAEGIGLDNSGEMINITATASGTRF